MAKKKRRGGKRKISLAVVGGVTAALAPVAQRAITGDFVGAGYDLAQRMTGFNPATGTFNPAALMQGLVPIMIGAGVSMAVSKFGLNRYLNLPFVKI